MKIAVNPKSHQIHVFSTTAEEQGFTLVYVFTSPGSAACVSAPLQLWSGPFCSKNARLLFLPDARAQPSNWAEFNTEQTGGHTQKQQHDINIYIIFPINTFLILWLVTLTFCLFVVFIPHSITKVLRDYVVITATPRSCSLQYCCIVLNSKHSHWGLIGDGAKTVAEPFCNVHAVEFSR